MIFFTPVFPYHLECQALIHVPFVYKQAGNQKEPLNPQRNGNCLQKRESCGLAKGAEETREEENWR